MTKDESMGVNGDSGPRVFLLDGPWLLKTRSRVCDGDPSLQGADQRLLQEAEEAMEVGPFTVTDKETVPPSGDRADYASQGPYWWPDPDMPDGVPFVRRDGEVYPERDEHDRQALAAMCGAVNTLALAYFFSDHERFAERAGLLLRTWFLDRATRMNPNLEYAQAIPGRCQGRGIGIIDTLQLSWLVDAVGLLADSPAWTKDDEAQLRAWCAEYLEWMLTSANGRDEARQRNNHGTWYDVQVLSLSLYSDSRDSGQQVAEHSAFERMASQIEPDGRQPLELARTRSLDYSTMNLLAFFDMAELLTHFDCNLWESETPDGRSLRAALRWLAETALGDEAWPYEQITEFDRAKLAPLLRRGAHRFGDARMWDLLEALEGDGDVDDRMTLLYPAHP